MMISRQILNVMVLGTERVSFSIGITKKILQQYHLQKVKAITFADTIKKSTIEATMSLTIVGCWNLAAHNISV